MSIDSHTVALNLAATTDPYFCRRAALTLLRINVRPFEFPAETLAKVKASPAIPDTGLPENEFLDKLLKGSNRAQILAAIAMY